MKVSKHFKVILSLLGLMALALTLTLSTGQDSVAQASLINAAQKEVQCDFKQNIFKQWAYIFGVNTSCVYR